MAGWMKTPLGTEVDFGPGHIVLDGVPAPTKASQQPPYSRPMSTVATVAHHSYCLALVNIFLQAGCPSCRPTNRVKALKA